MHRAPRRLAPLLIVIAATLASASARAEEGAPPPPDVSLDRLLKLPDDYGVDSERRGGAGASEWRRRFRDAHARLDSARERLARTQSQLEQVAQDSDQWQMAAPGTSTPENSPLSYKLREDLRRQRDEVALAERQLKDLEVEANLAGVPEQWRKPAP
jgi:hypothetical protein